MTLQDEIDAKRREIQTDAFQISIGELTSLYKEEELDIHPEFQRFFRWSIEQKSRLIESLLLGIPLPSIFVHQREDGVWDVIDGLQRMSTIFQFQGVLRDEAQKVVPPQALVATQYLPSVAGMYWEEELGKPNLTSTQRLLLKRSSVDVKIVKRESDPNTKFDLFQRLNSGGSQLSDQELRNCLLIMEERTFYSWVRELNAHPTFQATVAPSDRARDEQYDLELVIRFLAIEDADETVLKSIGDMADFLTTRALAFAADLEYPRATIETKFRTVFDQIDQAMGDDAFRRFDPEKNRFTGGFSVSSFEAFTAGVAGNLEALTQLPDGDRAPFIRERTQALWTNETFRTRAGSGITASRRIPSIVPLGRELFRP